MREKRTNMIFRTSLRNVFRFLACLHLASDRAKIWTTDLWLLVLQFELLDHWEVICGGRYQARIVVTIFFLLIFLILYFMIVSLLFGQLLSTSYALFWDSFCILKFDHSGAWLTGPCPWFLLLILKSFQC